VSKQEAEDHYRGGWGYKNRKRKIITEEVGGIKAGSGRSLQRRLEV
jgi:hypothetical protein